MIGKETLRMVLGFLAERVSMLYQRLMELGQVVRERVVEEVGRVADEAAQAAVGSLLGCHPRQEPTEAHLARDEWEQDEGELLWEEEKPPAKSWWRAVRGRLLGAGVAGVLGWLSAAPTLACGIVGTAVALAVSVAG